MIVYSILVNGLNGFGYALDKTTLLGILLSLGFKLCFKERSDMTKTKDYLESLNGVEEIKYSRL